MLTNNKKRLKKTLSKIEQNLYLIPPYEYPVRRTLLTFYQLEFHKLQLNSNYLPVLEKSLVQKLRISAFFFFFFCPPSFFFFFFFTYSLHSSRLDFYNYVYSVDTVPCLKSTQLDLKYQNTA